MKIGCIGWGSLIWDPQGLLINKHWNEDGPHLPVEFLRKSDDGRLTLVLHEDFLPVPTLWSLMTTEDLDQAIESLMVREKCTTTRPIGAIRKSDPLPENGIKQTIHAWVQNKDLDAVIWTNLGPRFRDTNGVVPKKEEALEYLAQLPDSIKKLAETYIRRAPVSVKTQYRCEFEKAFGWTYTPN